MDQRYKEIMERPRIYMNKEEGVVQELRGKKALVLTDRHTMCGQCVAKGYCHMLGGGKEMLSEARNPIGAQPGDTVVVGIPEGSLTRASLVIYMVPAIGLVGGATLGYYTPQPGTLDLNLTTLIGSLAGLGLAMIAVRLLSNTLSKKPSYQPEIIEIVNP
ncbi:MAG: SoxR reducing system RseC family protein [Deltaproteobacteria bacterium]|nr:SoxR reducing system RseC family protein [Deltaproteobacteria bacterium]